MRLYKGAINSEQGFRKNKVSDVLSLVYYKLSANAPDDAIISI